ncbi:unnamed protein product [Arabidopsis lyrata]|nr:unnamed protein product [Arabidopsis lyrata]
MRRGKVANGLGGIHTTTKSKAEEKFRRRENEHLLIMDEAGRMRRHDETMTLIKNYLEQHGMSSTVQALDIERGKLPNLATFTSLLLGGNFEDAVTYFCQFQNEVSLASCHILYFIWRQLFSELLSMNNRIQAKTVLFINMFPSSRVDLSLIHDYDKLKISYENNTIPTVDVESERAEVVKYVENQIQRDVALRSMFYPTIMEGQNRLQTLLEQSVNWQHRDCVHSTGFTSLLNEHHCQPPPANNNTDLNASSSRGRFDDGMIHEFGQPTQHSPSLEFTFDSDDANINELFDGLVVPSPFPKEVMNVLNLSHVTGMEFHPQLPLILVCTTSGEIKLFKLNASNYPNGKEFKIWKFKALSQELKDDFVKKERKTAGAVCVAWGSHGNNTNYAVGFCEGLVQTYNYTHDTPTKQHLEIEAHSGPVNDIVFYSSQGELKIVTCGDDKHIKAWNSSDGLVYWKLTHTAPLNSLALHQDGNKVQLFISDVFGSAIKPNIGYNGQLDGIPLLFPSDMNARLELKFSGDGKRLFYCGPGRLVEVDRVSFETRRSYNSVMNPQTKRMDICKNGYIAVGDEHSVKVWQLDNGEDYFTRICINNDRNFPECPMIKFNREGTLLAVVSLSHLRILANNDGKSLLADVDGGLPHSGRRYLIWSPSKPGEGEKERKKKKKKSVRGGDVDGVIPGFQGGDPTGSGTDNFCF